MSIFVGAAGRSAGFRGMDEERKEEAVKEEEVAGQATVARWRAWASSMRTGEGEAGLWRTARESELRSFPFLNQFGTGYTKLW